MKITDLQKPLNYGFFDLSTDEYNNIRALNNSSLKLGEISPYHIDCSLNHKYEDEDKKDFQIGRAYHKLIFEPDIFENTYYPFNRENLPCPDKDLRNKENKEYKKALEKEAAQDGKEILDMEDYNLFCKMREGLLFNRNIRALIETKGKTEYSMIWNHSNFNINCKARIDKLIPGHYIIDIKTIKDLRDWDYQYNRYAYKFQSAFYSEGYETLTSSSIKFIFIAQEKKFPYYAKAYPIGDKKLKESREKYYQIIETYIDYISGNYKLEDLELDEY